jgi:RNA polymerase sigma factor (sigma-70 family)
MALTATDQETQSLSYVLDPRIQTKTAAAKAKKLAAWIHKGVRSEAEPDETTLFTALQTCAYRATRQPGKTDIPRAEREKWTNDWKCIRDYIVEKNMGLAYSMVSRFRPHHANEDDLLSDALFALLRAVERFNPWKGYRLSTYACTAIHRELVHRDRRESTHRKRFPIHHDVAFERPEPLHDLQSDVDIEQFKQALGRHADQLTSMESRVLAMRFPLDRTARFTLQKASDAVGLSKERVRQIQKLALRKLREALNEDPLL